MVLSVEERKALDYLIQNPKAVVKCPRCGAVIELQRFETAFVVKCANEGCIKKSFRGI